jgi:ribose 5-phosphate isomerase B
MRIAMGADHAGYELKNKIRDYLMQQGFDYPDFAAKVGNDVASHAVDRGILVCGSGIGMAISANKVHGVRAANITSEYEAQMSREHNDLNVLTLGARILDEAKALKIVDLWLKTQFAGDRHQRRIQKMMAIEK